jgi:hypothetical protein
MSEMTNEFIASKEFLNSYQWRQLRIDALSRYGSRCMCCGAEQKDGVVMNVDHIRPRKLYPSLALVFDNLQVLCNVCNHGKGNWLEHDWRSNDFTQEQKSNIPDGSKLFKVTKQWIEDNSTSECRSGFTFAQIALLTGEATKESRVGWKNKSIGKMITLKDARLFEEYGLLKRKSKK